MAAVTEKRCRAGAENQSRSRCGKVVTGPMWKSSRGAGAAGNLRQDGACDRFFLSSLKMQHHGGVALDELAAAP